MARGECEQVFSSVEAGYCALSHLVRYEVPNSFCSSHIGTDMHRRELRTVEVESHLSSFYRPVRSKFLCMLQTGLVLFNPGFGASQNVHTRTDGSRLCIYTTLQRLLDREKNPAA
jgi:hypothetical protein